ncbi:MAG: SocA family protein [Trueperaceae bacterium]|nr:SocA family protein [Trueperaceae bacterium]
MMTRNGAPEQQPNAQKLAELIVYVANRSEVDVHFGATKLNKILFYSDFTAYERLGRSISGYEYIRLNFGPCPRGADGLRRVLESQDRIVMKRLPHFNQVQHRIIAMDEANLSLFTADEIAIVDEVLDAVKDLNATDVSNASHRFLGWKLAAPCEAIPYAVTLVDAEPDLTEDQTAFAVAQAIRIAKEAVPA